MKNVDKQYRYDVELVLYAFVSKFLEGKDLDMVKEELKLTKLGKSLNDEGKKKKPLKQLKQQ